VDGESLDVHASLRSQSAVASLQSAVTSWQ